MDQLERNKTLNIDVILESGMKTGLVGCSDMWESTINYDTWHLIRACTDSAISNLINR